MRNSIKGSSVVALAMLFSMLLIQCEAVHSKPKTYMVGDEEGWDLVIDMESWTKGKNFHAGDILVFKYDSQQFDVVIVNQQGHDSCTVNPGATTFDSGDDAIPLAFGANYFIDSDHDARAAGMKMAINATAPPPSI
ncbi:hypothetical protein POUND7_016856 [Theobroma cacao]